MKTIYSLRFTPVESALTDEEKSALSQDESRELYMDDMLAKVSCDTIGEILFEDKDVAACHAKMLIESIQDVYNISEPIMEYNIKDKEVN